MQTSTSSCLYGIHLWITAVTRCNELDKQQARGSRNAMICMCCRNVFASLSWRALANGRKAPCKRFRSIDDERRQACIKTTPKKKRLLNERASGTKQGHRHKEQANRKSQSHKSYSLTRRENDANSKARKKEKRGAATKSNDAQNQEGHDNSGKRD